MTPQLTFQNGRPTDATETARCPDCSEHVLNEWNYCPFCGVAL